MKKIDININGKNYEKIAREIAEAEGRSTVRTITVDDIVGAVKEIEETLGIPKSSMVGIDAKINIHAQKFPKKYKYVPMTTIVCVTRKRTCWAVTQIYRGVCDTHRISLILTKNAKDKIIESKEEF